MNNNMKSWMDLIFVVTPVVLSPIIAWLLGHSGLPSEEARMNYHLKRLDLISKLNQMQSEITDDRIKEMFDAELEICKQQMAFHSHEMIVQTNDLSSVPKTWIGKIFLTNPSKTIKQRVFKGLFYFFLAIFIFGLSAALLLPSQTPDQDWKLSLFGSLLYLSLALGFRALARPKSK
jgi:hypothetical protein